MENETGPLVVAVYGTKGGNRYAWHVCGSVEDAERWLADKAERDPSAVVSPQSQRLAKGNERRNIIRQWERRWDRWRQSLR